MIDCFVPLSLAIFVILKSVLQKRVQLEMGGSNSGSNSLGKSAQDKLFKIVTLWKCCRYSTKPVIPNGGAAKL